MPVRIQVSGINQTLAQVEREVEREVDRELRRRTLAAFREVRLQNPVDTGFSRNAWEVDEPLGKQQVGRFEFDQFEVINYSDYIQYLNDGQSSQAGAQFIERAFLRYFDDVDIEIYDDARGGIR